MKLNKFKLRGPSPSKTLHLILYLFSSIFFLKEPTPQMNLRLGPPILDPSLEIQS